MATIYRSLAVAENVSAQNALARAARWARRYGMPRATFLRSVVRVVSVRAADAASRESAVGATPDGLVVVDAATPADLSAESELRARVGTQVPDYRVYYRLATGEGAVDVALTPARSTARGESAPLTLRLTAAAVALALGVGIAVGLYRAHVEQGAWYALHGGGRALLAGGVAAAVGVVAALAELLLGKSVRRLARVAAYLAVVGAGIAYAAHAVNAHRPDADHALALLRGGHGDEASLEAAAFDATPRGRARAESAVDALALAQIPPDASTADIVHALRERWERPAARQRLLAWLQRAALREADVLPRPSVYMPHDLEALGDEVSYDLPALRDVLWARAALLRARDECMEGPAPDALCFVRAIEAARDGRLSEAEIARSVTDFVARAQAVFRREIDEAAADDGADRAEAAAMFREHAAAFARHLHVGVALDLTPLAPVVAQRASSTRSTLHGS